MLGNRYILYVFFDTGEEALDTDVPTEFEGRFFTTTGRKFLWLFLQPLFYAFRPLIIYKKALTDMELLNAIVQVNTDSSSAFFISFYVLHSLTSKQNLQIRKFFNKCQISYCILEQNTIGYKKLFSDNL